MPKNKDLGKSKMKAKSMRKPLRDVSNAAKVGTMLPSGNKSLTKGPKIRDTGDDSLDRLLLVHTDLSSFLQQVDELVVQALQLSSEKARKEIESFANILSEMQNSLKPWLPKLQKVLSSQSTGAEDKLEQHLEKIAVPAVNDDTVDIVESPEKSEWDSLISPSPLVSWKAGCNTEGGRQLFLLTPLPQSKGFSSKCQASSKSALQNLTGDLTTQPFTLPDIVGNKGDDSLESTPMKVLDSKPAKTVCKPAYEHASPAKFPSRNCTAFLMTPCLKMSPPKSCVLLEPLSEYSMKPNQGVRKSTPSPVVAQDSGGSVDSELSSRTIADNLTLKYPELFGIKLGQGLGNRKAVQESPKWLMSPPKTCVLMDPPDEQPIIDSPSESSLPKTAYSFKLPANLTSTKQSEEGHCATLNTLQQDVNGLETIESTPIMKEPQSTIQTGKQPGENTLKKELWTKFEAATTQGFRFNVSLPQKNARKGFLDRLDEASSDETMH